MIKCRRQLDKKKAAENDYAQLAEEDEDIDVGLDAGDMEEEGDEKNAEALVVYPLTGALTEFEKQITLNKALHSHSDNISPTLNTCVHACKTCGIHLLDFARKIHSQEFHSDIKKEADGICAR